MNVRFLRCGQHCLINISKSFVFARVYKFWVLCLLCCSVQGNGACKGRKSNSVNIICITLLKEDMPLFLLAIIVLRVYSFGFAEVVLIVNGVISMI